MIWEQLDESLIFINLEKQGKEELLKEMAQSFVTNDYCNESFVEAVIAREAVYPTGIKLEKMGVAIPHADAKHVIKDGVGFAILREPVAFLQMGGSEGDDPADVRLVIMLATKGRDHIGLLQKTMQLLQNEAILEEIMKVQKEVELIEIIKKWENENENI